MKQMNVLLLAVGVFAVGSWWSLADGPSQQAGLKPEANPQAQNKAAQPAEPQPDPIERFMRAKLRHSQQALEGLVTENFDRIRLSASQMQLMSQAAEWTVIEGPEYRRHSLEFRRAAEELADAARKQNGDAAALAYLQVTLSCVNCHKFVRSVRVARVDGLDAFPLELR